MLKIESTVARRALALHETMLIKSPAPYMVPSWTQSQSKPEHLWCDPTLIMLNYICPMFLIIPEWKARGKPQEPPNVVPKERKPRDEYIWVDFFII